MNGIEACMVALMIIFVIVYIMDFIDYIKHREEDEELFDYEVERVVSDDKESIRILAGALCWIISVLIKRELIDDDYAAIERYDALRQIRDHGHVIFMLEKGGDDDA